MKRLSFAAVSLIALLAAPAMAQHTPVIDQNAVAAHIGFLAGDELQGRGSATRDEAIAAAYVTAQFRLAGLTRAPGMTGFVQRAQVVKTTPSGAATVTVGGTTLNQGADFAILTGGLNPASGAVTVAADPAALPTASETLMIAPAEGPGVRALFGAAMRSGAKLILLRRTEALAAATGDNGSRDPVIRLADATPRVGPVVLVLAPEAYDRLASAGGTASYDPGPSEVEQGFTSNAIGWLQGTDPSAGVLMVSAHLDHIGVRSDGVVMHGANDDASGTVAVIELANALAASGPHERSIMFVAYGSEEAGLLGSRYFVDHPPIPLEDIAANLEIEMIGDQDPQLPAGVMMMTGFERSNFGAALKERGALVGPDPYPEQNFFQRSDNYALALKGIVAHTISGWATIPTYHTAEDTIENLDIPFMTNAIQSLVEPLKAMADGDFTPEWADGGRPE
ncbi:MAG: peptidase M28 [Brevundimonas subvibrioides]|uniref:Peptidase M28 n=1 Tax=Brevundimonas subvibrioides TaxID=74313 RepID=A0A258HRE2_9CAUL|nr:M20/M25/M40 family metallo-hydrolase [Brevundimonas subvibrioides]OYX59184.1 MAG: peptidase M28 [Brevundimonas subvibrioides]